MHGHWESTRRAQGADPKDLAFDRSARLQTEFEALRHGSENDCRLHQGEVLADAAAPAEPEGQPGLGGATFAMFWKKAIWIEALGFVPEGPILLRHEEQRRQNRPGRDPVPIEDILLNALASCTPCRGK